MHVLTMFQLLLHYWKEWTCRFDVMEEQKISVKTKILSIPQVTQSNQLHCLTYVCNYLYLNTFLPFRFCLADVTSLHGVSMKITKSRVRAYHTLTQLASSIVLVCCGVQDLRQTLAI